MKKRITEETVMIYTLGSIGYGLGYMVPASLGYSPIVCLIVCMVAGSVCWGIVEKIVYSRFMQKTKHAKAVFVVFVIGIFYLARILSKKFLDYDLIEELGNEIVCMLGFSAFGFAVSFLRRYLSRKNIRERYHGETNGSYIISNQEKEYINSLSHDNREVSGSYRQENAVKTRQGIYVGKKYKRQIHFCGIPYAKPPVGELRWKAPQPVESSEKIYEAMGFSPSPIQHNSKGNVLAACRQSEDCLYLNVGITRSKKKNKPVVVVFPGMDYTKGGAMDPMSFGDGFLNADPDSVFVSFNHRLGLLGFIDFSKTEGGEAYPDARNLGLLDQIAALKWVKENISAFGGDPGNITVMGTGAGAISISILAVCEAAAGLFQKAVILGGTPSLVDTDAENAVFLAKRLTESTGAKNMEDLMKLSEEELSRQTQSLESYLCGVSVQDGLVPADVCGLYQKGKASGIRFLFGVSEEDFLAYRALLGGPSGTEAGKAYEDEIKKELDGTAVYESVKALFSSSGDVRCLRWKIKGEVNGIGSGSNMIQAAFLGNPDAAEALGCIIPDDIAEVLQALFIKFLKEEKTELYNNEIPGIHEILWEPYPNELVVKEDDIICEKYRI